MELTYKNNYLIIILYFIIVYFYYTLYLYFIINLTCTLNSTLNIVPVPVHLILHSFFNIYKNKIKISKTTFLFYKNERKEIFVFQYEN